jgi:hypothetical protein
MEDLWVIRSFVNNVEAELARSALEAAGIESIIRADDGGGTYPWGGGVELLVRPEDGDRAAEVLGTVPQPVEQTDE